MTTALVRFRVPGAVAWHIWWNPSMWQFGGPSLVGQNLSMVNPAVTVFVSSQRDCWNPIPPWGRQCVPGSRSQFDRWVPLWEGVQRGESRVALRVWNLRSIQLWRKLNWERLMVQMIRFGAWFWALPLYPCLKVDRCFVALTSPGSWTWFHTASKRHWLDKGGGWRIAGLRAWGENPMRWRNGAPRICFINQPQVSIPVSGLKGLTWIGPRSSKGVYGMEDRLDTYRRFGNYDSETTLWELRLGN